MTGSACRCGPVRRIRLSASGETSCVRTRQVDIVHVTNLRLSESVDPVPSDESHLMEFPVPRRLFVDKTDPFDLIIFDRYERRGFLPDGHIATIIRHVREGGAVLVAGGREFAAVQGRSGGPLDAILPLSRLRGRNTTRRTIRH